MSKNVLIISASPRKGGNSDTLCDQFRKGAEEAGNRVDKIRLAELSIDYCSACYACKKIGHCVKQDDMEAVLSKMREADVIVLATPVYFFTMCAQMKTMIDRTLGGAGKAGLENKEFYLIATAADGKAAMERTIDGLRGYMKKITAILLSAMLVLSLAACGNNNQNTDEDTSAGTAAPVTEPADSSTENTTEPAEDETESTETSDTTETGNSNILVAYFSVMETDGVDTVAGASRVVVNGEVLGNNEYIAQIIQRETGGDLFSIETVQDYPTTHDPLLEFAYNEKADNARPELATQIENLDSYDVIFLGYPNWLAYHNLIQCTQA